MNTDIYSELRNNADNLRAKHSLRYFKTGPGEYGEGDKFLGLSMPQMRIIAKNYSDLPTSDVIELLHGEWHEERMVALLILNLQFAMGDETIQTEIYKLYLANTNFINNWDLVDCSAYKIVGPYLANRPEKMQALTKLANSKLLWERRIAIVSTLYNSGKLKSAVETIELAHILLHDDQDLIHKAVGWTLREAGKNVDVNILLKFLNEHAHEMPRTMLRYSIEKLDEELRQHYLKL